MGSAAVHVILLLPQTDSLGTVPPKEGTLAHYPVCPATTKASVSPTGASLFAASDGAQAPREADHLAAFGLHVMPRAEVRAAPGMLLFIAARAPPTATNASAVATMAMEVFILWSSAVLSGPRPNGAEQIEFRMNTQ